MITLGEIHYHACGDQLHSVQTGDPAFNKVFGSGLFDYLGQHPEAAGSFNQGMTDLSSMLAYAVVFAYDFAGIFSIVDIGGGDGRVVEKILEFHPHIQGTFSIALLLSSAPGERFKPELDAHTYRETSSIRSRKEQMRTSCAAWSTTGMMIVPSRFWGIVVGRMSTFLQLAAEIDSLEAG